MNFSVVSTSSLRQKNVSVEDYAVVSLAWSANGMKPVINLFIWYNNLDVVPFLKALETQCPDYEARGIEMLKQAISLPGFSMQWMLSIIEDRQTYRQALIVSQKLTLNEGLMSYGVIKRATVNVQQVCLVDEDNADLYNLIRENSGWWSQSGISQISSKRGHQDQANHLRRWRSTVSGNCRVQRQLSLSLLCSGRNAGRYSQTFEG